MKKSYVFYGLDHFRYVLMFICFFVGLVMVFGGILGALKTELAILVNELLAIGMLGPIYGGVFILLMISYFFLATKIASLYADEKWIICFDDKEIEISSNRRPKKIFPLSQLKEFTFSRSKKSKWVTNKKIEIKFQFNRKGLFPQYYMIDVYKYIFSSARRKSSYESLSQFLDSFCEQTSLEHKIKDRSFYFSLK